MFDRWPAPRVGLRAARSSPSAAPTPGLCYVTALRYPETESGRVLRLNIHRLQLRLQAHAFSRAAPPWLAILQRLRVCATTIDLHHSPPDASLPNPLPKERRSPGRLCGVPTNQIVRP